MLHIDKKKHCGEMRRNDERARKLIGDKIIFILRQSHCSMKCRGASGGVGRVFELGISKSGVCVIAITLRLADVLQISCIAIVWVERLTGEYLYHW